jgi:hypothetical protein
LEVRVGGDGVSGRSGTYVGSPASGLSTTSRDYYQRRNIVASRTDRSGGIGGISVGGILVIIGIVLMLVVSFWIGLIVLLVGLIAFGGFARGKWY